MKLDHIIQGNSIHIMSKMPQNSIHAMITDPPYNYEFMNENWNNKEILRRTKRVKHSNTMVKNIPYGSSLSGGVRNKRWYQRNRLNVLQYQDWCEQWGKEAYRILKPGAIALIFNNTRMVAHVQIAMENVGFYPRDIIVWKRNSGIPKGLNAGKKLKSQHNSNYKTWLGWHSALRTGWEAIDVVQKPLDHNYINTLKKYHTGLFHTERPDLKGFQSDLLLHIHREKKDLFNTHPTVKPLSLTKDLIKLVMPLHSSNIVIDPFLGSGTTAVASKLLGVHWIGIEINPKYIKIAKERLNKIE